jgi:hypothetical protein
LLQTPDRQWALEAKQLELGNQKNTGEHVYPPGCKEALVEGCLPTSWRHFPTIRSTSNKKTIHQLVFKISEEYWNTLDTQQGTLWLNPPIEICGKRAETFSHPDLAVLH